MNIEDNERMEDLESAGEERPERAEGEKNPGGSDLSSDSENAESTGESANAEPPGSFEDLESAGGSGDSEDPEGAGRSEDSEDPEGDEESENSENSEEPERISFTPEQRDSYEKRIEGILFAMGDSVEAKDLARTLSLSVQDTVELCEGLSERYEQEHRGIRITRLENSFQMCSAKEVYSDLIQLASLPKKTVLSDTLLETLSIIAYKQPVTKAEIDRIRGVASGHSVSKLISYSLVEEVGRLDAAGRPILFGTTEEFLRSFGVSSLEELPTLSTTQMEEFRMEAEAEADQIEVDV